MDARGNLHAPVALPLRKKPDLSIIGDVSGFQSRSGRYA
jgi:hypothetical protein